MDNTDLTPLIRWPGPPFRTRGLGDILFFGNMTGRPVLQSGLLERFLRYPLLLRKEWRP